MRKWKEEKREIGIWAEGEAEARRGASAEPIAGHCGTRAGRGSVTEGTRPSRYEAGSSHPTGLSE